MQAGIGCFAQVLEDEPDNLGGHEVILDWAKLIFRTVSRSLKLHIDDKLPAFRGSNEPEMQIPVARMMGLAGLHTVFHTILIWSPPALQTDCSRSKANLRWRGCGASK
jgi:hypothetical protein